MAKRKKLHLVLESVLLIFVAPAIIFALETLTHHLASWSALLYDQIHLALYILVIIILSLIELLLQRFSVGKGDIVTLKELESGDIHVRPIFDTIIMFINVSLTFFICLPLGQEGPSVFLIASMAIFFFRHEEYPSYDEAVDLGAAIGYGLAFYNPLAGLCFGFEAMKKKFELRKFVHFSFLMLGAYFVLLTYRFLFQGATTGVWEYSFKAPLFENGLEFMMDGYEWLIIFFLPFISFLLARLFNFLCVFIRPLFVKGEVLTIVIALALSVFMVCWSREEGLDALLGAGGGLIDGEEIIPLEAAAFALLVRIIFSSLAFSFPHTGGQAIPTLAIGALIGTCIGHLFAYIFPTISENAIAIYTIIGAICFYGASTNYRFTSFFLIFSFGNPVALALPAFIGIGIIVLISIFYKGPSLEHILRVTDRENVPYRKRTYLAFR